MDIDLRIVVALAAFFLGVLQYWTSKRRLVEQNTFQLLESFNANDARLARFRYGDYLREAAQNENGFDGLTDDKLSELSLVAANFGLAGILGKQKKINLNLFLEMWGEVAIRAWERLEPYRSHYKDKYGRSVGHWHYFEWLVLTAQKKS